jgi:acetyl esterase/lipase
MRTRAKLLILITILCATTISAASPIEMRVWPGLPPGETGPVKASENPPPKSAKKIERIYVVNDPIMTVFRAPEDRANGAAIVVCPGGGYKMLAYDLEGTEVAAWLNTIGVTAVVLKYRVPRRDETEFHRAPLQDAQRAIRLTRQNARAWAIDPERIGILGFSAGGHLTVLAGTRWDRTTYPAIDAADELSPRPDFLVPVYPSYLTDKANPEVLHPLVRITADTPPTFIAVAQNDGHAAVDSARLFIALKNAGVPTELHIYSSGGHGFGLRPTDEPVTDWPQRVEEWMRASHLLGGQDRNSPTPAVARKDNTPAAPTPAGITTREPAAPTAPTDTPVTKLRRVTVETRVPLKTTFLQKHDQTVVSTPYAQFPGGRFLTPKIWIRLRHAFAGKTRPESVESIDMHVRFGFSGGRHRGRKLITLVVDGKKVDLPVTHRDEESKIEKRGRKRLRRTNEVLWAKITTDQLARLARAQKITLMPEELDLSREQIALFPAMHRDVTGK